MWLEAEKQLLEALITMLQTGGQYALWGVFGWFTFELLKILFIGGLIWACIRLITQTITGIMVTKSLVKGGGVTLLSEKVAKHVTEALTDFTSRCSSILDESIKKQEPEKPATPAADSTKL